MKYKFTAARLVYGCWLIRSWQEYIPLTITQKPAANNYKQTTNCMVQQSIALIIISYFLIRLVWRKSKSQLTINEFVFWLFLWLLVAVAVIFIKNIDQLVASLGFSSSGINVLLYLGVVLLFYWVFRLRIKIEKINKDITKIVRDISIKNKNER